MRDSEEKKGMFASHMGGSTDPQSVINKISSSPINARGQANAHQRNQNSISLTPAHQNFKVQMSPTIKEGNRQNSFNA